MVGLLGLLVLSAGFDLESEILHLCMMSRTASTTDPFDGSATKAIPFWNSLANYYGINSDLYTNKSRKVAAALTHFKLGTSAGDWASDQLSTALAATPVNYRTWAAFKAAFETQFVPPQTQVEAIQKIHNLLMGNCEFNKWY